MTREIKKDIILVLISTICSLTAALIVARSTFAWNSKSEAEKVINSKADNRDVYKKFEQVDNKINEKADKSELDKKLDNAVFLQYIENAKINNARVENKIDDIYKFLLNQKTQK